MLILRHPPSSTLFPYTTLFRSGGGEVQAPGRPAPGDLLLRPEDQVDPRQRRRRPGEGRGRGAPLRRSEEHTSELQSRGHLVCRLLLEKKKTLIGESAERPALTR